MINESCSPIVETCNYDNPIIDWIEFIVDAFIKRFREKYTHNFEIRMIYKFEIKDNGEKAPLTVVTWGKGVDYILRKMEGGVNL